MFRYFETLIARKENTTAIKILHGIIDKNCYLTEHDWFIEIINKNVVVAALAGAIRKSIDYPEYQNLDRKIKDEIKGILIQKLNEQAEQFVTTDINNSGYTRKGLIITSIWTGSRSFTRGQFPEGLFENQSLLEKYIEAALQEKYSGILLSSKQLAPQKEDENGFEVIELN